MGRLWAKIKKIRSGIVRMKRSGSFKGRFVCSKRTANWQDPVLTWDACRATSHVRTTWAPGIEGTVGEPASGIKRLTHRSRFAGSCRRPRPGPRAPPMRFLHAPGRSGPCRSRPQCRAGAAQGPRTAERARRANPMPSWREPACRTDPPHQSGAGWRENAGPVNRSGCHGRWREVEPCRIGLRGSMPTGPSPWQRLTCVRHYSNLMAPRCPRSRGSSDFTVTGRASSTSRQRSNTSLSRRSIACLV